MIISLHIENIAVVKRLYVDLSGGFTVLTGETGAGKSIIIDSLNLLLGCRADKELIRSGEDKASVSAMFCDIGDECRSLLCELGIECEEDGVLLSRAITQSGSSARINGRAVTLSMLREVSGKLFGIHGQNDNQQLLDPQNHIKLIDSYTSNGELLEKYSQKYREILATRCEIDSADRDTMEKARLCEILKFQIKDIDSVKPKKNEEQELEEIVARLSSAEKINKCRMLIDKALRGGEKGGAIYLVDRAKTASDAVAESLPEATVLADRLSNVRYELEDIAAEMSAMTDFCDEDPTAKLDKAQSRLDAISKLKRKYGGSVEEVIAFRDDAVARLEALENSEVYREELEKKLGMLCSEADRICDTLREKRREGARGLVESVTETLRFLDMPKVRFEVRITPSKDFLPSGKDNLEFMISANPGEPLMPMAKIASGGELARIMLALKNALNRLDGIGTVVFDEIDTGISGKTSRKVGIKLKEIGRESQVICVTHSAQIASLADNHFYISKREVEGRTETALRLLDSEERVGEIARILGGINITDAQRAAAKEMLDERENY
ncbi:MAG: DNA repair protein RecN [Clostridia bacterium]|nr:DNA repair protein RecN [Clostridia bacterium]